MFVFFFFDNVSFLLFGWRELGVYLFLYSLRLNHLIFFTFITHNCSFICLFYICISIHLYSIFLLFFYFFFFSVKFAIVWGHFLTSAFIKFVSSFSKTLSSASVNLTYCFSSLLPSLRYILFPFSHSFFYTSCFLHIVMVFCFPRTFTVSCFF